MFKLMVLVVVLIFVGVDSKFPINPKPCEYGDTDCFKKFIKFLIEQKSEGYRAINLVRFDPLKVSSINIEQGNESPVNINLRFRNAELLGLSKMEIIDIKGFDKDLTQQSRAYLKAPLLNLIADYTISGKMLILPIQGSGRSNITLENCDLVMSLSGTPQVKPDGIYSVAENSRLSIDSKRVHFHFENLFNGNKALSDSMNLFVNENWQDIFAELKVSIENAFAKIFEGVINNVFQKYPYHKFFSTD